MYIHGAGWGPKSRMQYKDPSYSQHYYHTLPFLIQHEFHNDVKHPQGHSSSSQLLVSQQPSPPPHLSPKINYTPGGGRLLSSGTRLPHPTTLEQYWCVQQRKKKLIRCLVGLGNLLGTQLLSRVTGRVGENSIYIYIRPSAGRGCGRL